MHTYQMGYDVLSAVDKYGNELNTETKRKLMQRCIMAPRFLRGDAGGIPRRAAEYHLGEPDGQEPGELRDPARYFCGYDAAHGKRAGGQQSFTDERPGEERSPLR